MGEEFTAEELAILGEEPVASPEGTGEPQVTDELVQEPETEHKEEVGEKPPYTVEGNFIVYENGEKIPIDRFEKVYFEKKEMERRVELLKSDPESYFTLYPEERPAPKQEAPASIDEQFQSLGEMVVKGGVYDGYTLNEVYAVDQATAFLIQTNYLNSITEQQRQEQAAQADLMKQVETEALELSNDLSRELFGADYKELSLSPENKAKVKAIDDKLMEVANWMKQTGRGGGNVKDAYYLMNRDAEIKRAMEKGAKGTIDALSRGSIPSINAGSGSGAPSSAYESMTPAQFSKAIENMPEAKFDELMKTGSQALREKYPQAPWT